MNVNGLNASRTSSTPSHRKATFTGGIVRKDFIRYLPFLAGMLFFQFIIIVINNSLRGHFYIMPLYAMMTWIGPFVFGYAVFYGESESNSWDFLRCLPLHPKRLIISKLFSAYLTSFLFVFFSGFILYVTNHKLETIFSGFQPAAIHSYWVLMPFLYIIACTVITGAVIAQLFPHNPLFGVVLGVTSIVLWLRFLSELMSRPGLSLEVRNLVPMVGTFMWFALSWLVLFSTTLQNRRNPSQRSRKISKGIAGFSIPGVVTRRWPMAPILLIHTLTITSIMILVSILASAEIITDRTKMFTLASITLISGLWLGVTSLTDNERMLPTHQIYHLPIARGTLLFARLRVLVFHILIILLIVVPLFFKLLLPKNGFENGVTFLLAFTLSMICLVAGSIIGILMRYLIRSPIMAAFPGMLLLCFILSITFAVPVFAFNYEGMPFYLSMLNMSWACAVAIAIPGFALWLLVTHGGLLESGDRQRLLAFILIFGSILIWEMIALLILPSDVWISITR